MQLTILCTNICVCVCRWHRKLAGRLRQHAWSSRGPPKASTGDISKLQWPEYNQRSRVHSAPVSRTIPTSQCRIVCGRVETRLDQDCISSDGRCAYQSWRSWRSFCCSQNRTSSKSIVVSRDALIRHWPIIGRRIIGA